MMPAGFMAACMIEYCIICDDPGPAQSRTEPSVGWSSYHLEGAMSVHGRCIDSSQALICKRIERAACPPSFRSTCTTFHSHLIVNGERSGRWVKQWHITLHRTRTRVGINITWLGPLYEYRLSVTEHGVYFSSNRTHASFATLPLVILNSLFFKDFKMQNGCWCRETITSREPRGCHVTPTVHSSKLALHTYLLFNVLNISGRCRPIHWLHYVCAPSLRWSVIVHVLCVSGHYTMSSNI